MATKGTISACDTRLRIIDGVQQYATSCVVSYLPTGFELEGIYCPIDITETVSAKNNAIQQFGMDIINAEVPGTIANKNEVALQGGFVS